MPWRPTSPRRRDLRPPANQRGYGYAHRQWRAKVLRAAQRGQGGDQPYCLDPFERHPGVLVPATVADHILPLSQGGDWSLENGRACCVSCHNSRTARDQARRA